MRAAGVCAPLNEKQRAFPQLETSVALGEMGMIGLW